LLQSSVARQVRVASKVLPQWPSVLVTVLRIVIVTLPQVSLAVGTSKVQAVVHSTDLADTQVMLGGVVSMTVIVWLQSAWLLQSSVARHVRVASKVLPQCPVVFVTVLTIVIVTLPQVSLAVGASKLQAVVHSTDLAGTQVMLGGVLSTTVTLWLQSAWLLQSSVARQVRVATNVLPQCPVVLVTVLRIVMVALPQVSLAVGASKFHALVHSTDLAGAQAMVGGVVSLTVIVWVQLAVLLCESVAVQVRVITLLQDDPGLLCDSSRETVKTPSQASSAVTEAAAGTLLKH
jgi:uncharacterized protein YhhL (DUF1145 family)